MTVFWTLNMILLILLLNHESFICFLLSLDPLIIQQDPIIHLKSLMFANLTIME